MKRRYSFAAFGYLLCLNSIALMTVAVCTDDALASPVGCSWWLVSAPIACWAGSLEFFSA
jgi:hypothetical protein